MPKLTADQVRHIAKLARLQISDEEVGQYASDLTSILDFIEQLKEVDTSKVEATAQVTGLENAFREDAVKPSGVELEALLECSPLPIVDHQIQTPSAHG